MYERIESSASGEVLCLLVKTYQSFSNRHLNVGNEKKYLKTDDEEIDWKASYAPDVKIM